MNLYAHHLRHARRALRRYVDRQRAYGLAPNPWQLGGMCLEELRAGRWMREKFQ